MSESKGLEGILATRFQKFIGDTVWDVFTPLARSADAVNLGQGFPGWAPVDFVRTALIDAAKVGEDATDKRAFLGQQYAPNRGHASLNQILAKQYAKKLGRESLDWKTEIAVHNGCSGALSCALLGLVNPGDEVVVLEPAFDLYFAQAEMCGAIVKGVPLQTRPVVVELGLNDDHEEKQGELEWYLDLDLLRASFNDKTKLFILNTPHNPTGKVFSRQELLEIVKVLNDFPHILVLSDEVYDRVLFDNATHTSIASLPDMYERCLTLQSAGKTFSVTGWKIGYAIGDATLVRATSTAMQWLAYCVNTPAQAAVARCLTRAEEPFFDAVSNVTWDNFYVYLAAEYARKKKLLVKHLQAVNIPLVNTQGTFFIVGDVQSFRPQVEKWLNYNPQETLDFNFCKWLTLVHRVTAIPCTAFYNPEHKHMAESLVRFAFCNTDELINEAGERLRQGLLQT